MAKAEAGIAPYFHLALLIQSFISRHSRKNKEAARVGHPPL
jgi:hypothetical protein